MPQPAPPITSPPPAAVAACRPSLSALVQKQVLSLYRSALRLSRAKEQQGGEAIAVLARAEIERCGTAAALPHQ